MSVLPDCDSGNVIVAADSPAAKAVPTFGSKFAIHAGGDEH
jgi:hypothetical protein